MPQPLGHEWTSISQLFLDHWGTILEGIFLEGVGYTMQDSSRAEQFFANKVDFTTGPAELKHMIEEKSVSVIDVRAQVDFEKAHIPGAKNLPKERWDSFEGLDRDKTNIIYCYSQNLSPGCQCSS